MTTVLKEREWKCKWETVHMDKDNCCSLERMRVPGGWLYKTNSWLGESECSTAMCFVPRTESETENSK